MHVLYGCEGTTQLRLGMLNGDSEILYTILTNQTGSQRLSITREGVNGQTIEFRGREGWKKDRM